MSSEPRGQCRYRLRDTGNLETLAFPCWWNGVSKIYGPCSRCTLQEYAPVVTEGERQANVSHTSATCWKCRCPHRWSRSLWTRTCTIVSHAQTRSPLPHIPRAPPSFGLSYHVLHPMPLPASHLGTPGPSQRVAALGPSLYANANPQLAPSFLSPLIDCFPPLQGLREPWSPFRRDLPHCPALPTRAPGPFNLVTFPSTHWEKGTKGHNRICGC